MRRHFSVWSRLPWLHTHWLHAMTGSYSLRGAFMRRALRRRHERPRTPAGRLDAQRLEPRLALAPVVGTKVTQVVVPTAGSYNAGDELAIRVTFNNSVTVTGQPNVNLVIGKTTIPATYVDGSGTNALSFRHVIAAGENDADGIVVAKAISLASGASIVDATTSQPASLVITPPSTAKVLIDTVAPAVTSVIGPAAKTYATGQTLSFTVNFTEGVFITGSPTLPVTIGGAVRNAVWNGKGDGSKSLVFTTKVQPGDSAPLGVQTMGVIGLADGATIRDRATNDANPVATGQFPRAKVDGIAPAVTSFGALGIDSKTKVASLQVTFSESVTVQGTAKPYISFTLNGVQKQLSYMGGAGKSTLTFGYTPSKGESPTLENVVVRALAITLPSKSSIVDSVGNATISLAAPTDVALSAASLAENNAIGAVVGSFTTTDSDAGDAFVYTLVPGTGSTDNTSFSIAGSQLKAAESFDYESKSSRSIRVRVTDAGGLSTEKTLTISITNVAEVALAVRGSGVYRGGDTLPFVVTYDRDVTLVGSAILSLDVGGMTRKVTLAAADRTGSAAGLTFNYVVQPGDSAPTGVQVLGLALADGATLKDTDGTNMPLSLPVVQTGGVQIDAATTVVPQTKTIVHFDTNVADFDVELFDAAMPITVANFLSYVSAGAYASTLIHRSTTYNPADIQVVQGGGFVLAGNQLASVAANPSIVLESGSTTNVRGTIAMARGAESNSATSQYFFNLQDNSALDGNYAVFGVVVGAAGLAALDAIGAVEVYDCAVQLGAAFGELPLTVRSLEAASLVLVNGITVVPG